MCRENYFTQLFIFKRKREKEKFEHSPFWFLVRENFVIFLNNCCLKKSTTKSNARLLDMFTFVVYFILSTSLLASLIALAIVLECRSKQQQQKQQKQQEHKSINKIRIVCTHKEIVFIIIETNLNE